MQLQAADGPHVVNVAFNGSLERLRFHAAQNQNHHFFGIQQGAYAYGQGVFWNLVNITVKEAGVCHARVMGQGFNTRTGSQRRGRFVERDMAIVAHATHEQVDFTVGTDFSSY